MKIECNTRGCQSCVNRDKCDEVDKHRCINCRYLAMERINGMPMYYCSIGNDEENAKQGNDEINNCPDFE